MCLSIKLFSRKQIAEQDIEVFKVLCSSPVGPPGWKTPYRKVPVSFSEPMEANLSRGIMSVNAGIHSYSTLTGARRAKAHMGDSDMWSWGLFEPDTFLIFKAVIPKGAEYYVGLHEYFDGLYTGSYASNKLILKKQHA
jgi:hypothetical protein